MDLDLDDSQKSKSKYQKKEHKWKELLYNLFYEIKSEIINSKIEIEEEEYQENINSTTIPQLVNYIHDSIQILLKKKIEDTKEEQKEIDKKHYLSSNSNLVNKDEKKEMNFAEYESIIRNLESKQRILTKNYFQQKLQIDAMENKIEEYMEMEDEFEEMKTKLKYEDGRFLNNDRKDNEILIIRGENLILKTEINKLEEKVKSLDELINAKEKKIQELNNEIEKMKNQIKTLKNDLNMKKIEIQEYISQLNKKNDNSLTATSIKPGERIITVNFISMGTQDIMNYSLICKNTELFVRLEERLYEDFPQFKNYETFFEVNTRRIKRFKTLDENNIKSKDLINIFIVDN